MEWLVFIGVLVVVIAGFAVVTYVLSQKLNQMSQQTASGLLKQDMIELTRGVAEMKDGLQQTMHDRLERNHVMMRESVQKQLGESAKLIADVTQRLTKLDETNRRVVDVADELKTLQNVLQNPKQRGVFGEYYLETVLGNVLPPGRYQMQYKFQDGQIVDAALFLDKGQILPIDSKFSLENYNRLIEEKDKATRDKLLLALRNDLKFRIDETSKYIRPHEKTMDFAFMFIPSEALYYDLLINKVGATGGSTRDLIEYAFNDKHVIIVSPTSFMAYLQTVMQGLRNLEIEHQAKEIQVRVGQLGRHIAAHETFMQKLGGSLSTTVNHFNNAHKELKKIDKDVVKIAGTEEAVEPLLVDKPQTDI